MVRIPRFSFHSQIPLLSHHTFVACWITNQSYLVYPSLLPHPFSRLPDSDIRNITQQEETAASSSSSVLLTLSGPTRPPCSAPSAVPHLGCMRDAHPPQSNRLHFNAVFGNNYAKLAHTPPGLESHPLGNPASTTGPDKVPWHLRQKLFFLESTVQFHFQINSTEYYWLNWKHIGFTSFGINIFFCKTTCLGFHTRHYITPWIDLLETRTVRLWLPIDIHPRYTYPLVCLPPGIPTPPPVYLHPRYTYPMDRITADRCLWKHK